MSVEFILITYNKYFYYHSKITYIFKIFLNILIQVFKKEINKILQIFFISKAILFKFLKFV